ncbi:MAG: hypothetical protein WCS85_05280 [Candidatus Peribacteraceae bacterium]|jgi:hypothetical protein
MRTSLRTLLVSFLLLWPLAAAARQPSLITGVRAEYSNGNIQVSWDAPAETEGIARYRVYYSHASILQNDGAFDDFETTEGTETSLTLTYLPPFPAAYVSVLAVNDAGEESPSFGAEAVVQLDGSDSQAVNTPSPSASSFLKTTTGNEQAPRLLLAQSISATGVLLTFSTSVTIAQETASTSFKIFELSGASLTVRSIALQGAFITLVTDPQIDGRAYVVSAAAVFSVPAPGGTPIPLDPASSTITFIAGNGILPTPQEEPVTTPEQTTEPEPAIEPLPTQTPPATLTLETPQVIGQQQHGKTFTLEMSFEVKGDTSTLDSLAVMQSTDGGQTFTPTQGLPATARMIRFEDVPAGNFVMAIVAHTTDGQIIRGQPVSVLLASTTGSGKPLTGSGPTAAAALLAAGAIAGWHRARGQRK